MVTEKLFSQTAMCTLVHCDHRDQHQHDAWLSFEYFCTHPKKAVFIFWNIDVALASLFLSGWYFFANFLYTDLMSSRVAVPSGPRTAYAAASLLLLAMPVAGSPSLMRDGGAQQVRGCCVPGVKQRDGPLVGIATGLATGQQTVGDNENTQQ